MVLGVLASMLLVYGGDRDMVRGTGCSELRVIEGLTSNNAWPGITSVPVIRKRFILNGSTWARRHGCRLDIGRRCEWRAWKDRLDLFKSTQGGCLLSCCRMP
jgi:hypothetical protein